MLKHETISQITFNHGYRIALVETASDYVVATDYKGHKECWGQGYYFPKWNGDLEARTAARNCYTDIIEKEICYWL